MNKPRKKRVSHWILFGIMGPLIAVMSIQAQQLIEIRSDWNPTMDNRMEWWHDAKYGMFIHWGLYSIPSGEWNGETTYGEWIMRGADIPYKEYEGLANKFNPVKFNADEWVQIAQEAGMKYIVITSKHHDGFCMFDSKYTDYDIIDRTPFGRDPLKELADACAKVGMHLGFYYSITDWHHPHFAEKWHGYHGNPNPEADLDVYVEFMQNQLRELLTNYGPIKILWFDDGGSFMMPSDGPVEAYMEEHPALLHSVETMNMVRSLQPDIIINDRLGYGTTDFMTPEQFVPEPGSYSAVHNFESCLTINGAWGHNKSEVNWKSPKEIIHELVQNASMGGNYLLNVGPMSNGKIDPVDTEILRGAGKWIHRNAEAIFSTQAGPVPQPDWGRITSRPLSNGNTRLYLHVFDWPRGSRSQPTQFAITVAGLENQPVQAYALTTIPRRSYSAEQNKGSIVIKLNGRRPDIVNSVVVLDLEGSIRKRKM